MYIIIIYIIIISLTIVMTGTAGSFGGWRKWAPDSSTPLSPSTWAVCAKKLTLLNHHHHHHHHCQHHQLCDRHHRHLEHHQHVYENLGAALYADAGWWSIAGVYHFTRGHNISSYWSYLASSSLSSHLNFFFITFITSPEVTIYYHIDHTYLPHHSHHFHYNRILTFLLQHSQHQKNIRHI